MEKYRTILIHSDYINDLHYVTYIVQVKKWYGWVTIKTVDGPEDDVYDKLDSILNLLDR